MRFAIVDVFAEAPLQGNPLAVVPDADQLNDDLMKRIAREFNQSETTFLLHPTLPEATWRLRSFTSAGVEVFGAGHNALGAWWWLAKTGLVNMKAGTGLFQQQIGERVLPVRIELTGDSPLIAMYHQPATFGQIWTKLDELANALGTGTTKFRDDLPAQVVSTGVAHLMVRLRDRASVDELQPRSDELLSVLRAAGGQGCYAFSLDPCFNDEHAYARFFNPTAGIWEDPATGSAAAPLACYLQSHGIRGNGDEYLVIQGCRMGRPSRLRIRLEGKEVVLLGSCVMSASGDLFLPQS